MDAPSRREALKAAKPKHRRDPSYCARSKGPSNEDSHQSHGPAKYSSLQWNIRFSSRRPNRTQTVSEDILYTTLVEVEGILHQQKH